VRPTVELPAGISVVCWSFRPWFELVVQQFNDAEDESARRSVGLITDQTIVDKGDLCAGEVFLRPFKRAC
jgi:hypothetical protein